MRLLLNVQKLKVFQPLPPPPTRGFALGPHYIILMNTTEKKVNIWPPHKNYCPPLPPQLHIFTAAHDMSQLQKLC